MKTLIKKLFSPVLDTYFINEMIGIDIFPLNESDKFLLKDKLLTYQIKSNITVNTVEKSVIYYKGKEIELKGKTIIPNQYKITEKCYRTLKQYPQYSPVLIPEGFIVEKVEDKKNNRKGYVLDFKQLSFYDFLKRPIFDPVFLPDWVLEKDGLVTPDERYVIS